MGFLSNLFSGREISRLEELVDTAPAPSIFMRLAQLYREGGQEGRALEVTSRGARMFPESEALVKAQADAAKVRNDAERRRILAKIEQYPSPMLYARLAKLYLKDGILDEAEAACRRGCRDYPEYGGLWAGLGEVALRHGDLQPATENLEKAAELDKYNYGALMLLAEVYLRRGLREQGRAVFARILEFAPGDDRVTAFLDDFDARAQALADESRDAGASSAGRGPAPKVAAAGGGGRGASGASAAAELDKKSSGVGTSLHVEIRQIRRVDGVQGTVLIDPSGLVIASDLPQGMDEDLSAALITSICRTVGGVAAELRIGEFEDGILDTDKGCIHILALDEMTMGVFAAPKTKAGLLQRAVHTFAERVIEEYH